MVALKNWIETGENAEALACIFSGGVQGGFNAGVDVHVGRLEGSLQDQEGSFLFVTASGGVSGVNITGGAIDNQQSSVDHYLNENDAKNPLSSMDPNGWFVGASLGLPVGAGTGYGEAEVWSIQGVIQRVKSWFDGDEEEEED